MLEIIFKLVVVGIPIAAALVYIIAAKRIAVENSTPFEEDNASGMAYLSMQIDHTQPQALDFDDKKIVQLSSRKEKDYAI